MDYNDCIWKVKLDGNVFVIEDCFFLGEIENNFSLIGEVKVIIVIMFLIRILGSENNYFVILDFSKYKVFVGGLKVSDGVIFGDIYLVILRFFNGSRVGYIIIIVIVIIFDGS